MGHSPWREEGTRGLGEDLGVGGLGQFRIGGRGIRIQARYIVSLSVYISATEPSCKSLRLLITVSRDFEACLSSELSYNSY